MTYAQGMAAQMTAVKSIGLASYIDACLHNNTRPSPSAVRDNDGGGYGGGLQRKTVTSILMAWVFTLPAAIFLSGWAVLDSIAVDLTFLKNARSRRSAFPF